MEGFNDLFRIFATIRRKPHHRHGNKELDIGMKRIVLFLLVSLLLSLKTMGQEDVISKEPVAEKNKARPRVALVLSGGGAKGMAHIGVLKVLERAGTMDLE